MPRIQEAAGYEDFFSTVEWAAIVSGDWSLLDDDAEVEEGWWA